MQYLCLRPDAHSSNQQCSSLAGVPTMSAKTFGNYTAFSTLATLVGCDDLAAAHELECMQKVDAQTLESVSSSNSGAISFTPVADNVTCYSNTTDRLANNLVTKVVSYPSVKSLRDCTQLTLYQ